MLENLRRVFAPHSTDYPWVFEDNESSDVSLSITKRLNVYVYVHERQLYCNADDNKTYTEYIY